MRFTTLLGLSLFQALPSLSLPSTPQQRSCGVLNPRDIDTSSLPTGVDPAQIRTCQEHPLNLLSFSPPEDAQLRDQFETDDTVAKRGTCWSGSQVGCSSGFCWAICEATEGKRCWFALNEGFGDWVRCSNPAYCAHVWQNPEQFAAKCGRTMPGKECKACGCKC